jgi:hypothetical protein
MINLFIIRVAPIIMKANKFQVPFGKIETQEGQCCKIKRQQIKSLELPMFELKSEGRKILMSQLEGSQPGGFPPCSQEGQSFCSFQVFN